MNINVLKGSHLHSCLVCPLIYRGVRLINAGCLSQPIKGKSIYLHLINLHLYLFMSNIRMTSTFSCLFYRKNEVLRDWCFTQIHSKILCYSFDEQVDQLHFSWLTSSKRRNNKRRESGEIVIDLNCLCLLPFQLTVCCLISSENPLPRERQVKTTGTKNPQQTVSHGSRNLIRECNRETFQAVSHHPIFSVLKNLQLLKDVLTKKGK